MLRLAMLAAALVLLAPGASRVVAQEMPEEDTLETPIAVPDTFVADDEPSKPAVAGDSIVRLVFDSSRIALRGVPDSLFDRYRSDNDFDYNREQREPESLWNRFLRWLYRTFERLLGGGENVGTVAEWIGYAIAAAAVAYVIYVLWKGDVRSLLRGGNRARVSPFAELDENIHEMNFDALIEEAVNARQYKRAVRLLYLKGLKVLADRGAINWRKDKTNRDYLHELRESPVRASFADATFLFEYVWYGDMPINESIFRSIRENLDGFITNIDRKG
jgi:hypothetical protein